MRREILEELFRLYQRASSASAVWHADRGNPEQQLRAREAEYLISRGLIRGCVGADGEVVVRLTPAGRDFVESGGDWGGAAYSNGLAATTWRTVGGVSEAQKEFLAWFRDACDAGDRLVLDELVHPPRHYFMQSGSGPVDDFYAKIDKWKSWHDGLVAGLQQHLQGADHIVADAAKRFGEERFLVFRLEDWRTAGKVVAEIDLSDRARYRDVRGYVAFRQLLNGTADQPDWRSVTEGVRNDLRAFRDRVEKNIPRLRFFAADSAAGAGSTVSAERVALLLVAVVTERKALLDELRDRQIATSDDEIGGRYVDTFRLPGREKQWNVIVGQATEKGPHAAQALVQDLARSCEPELVLLVGMCGGFPERKATDTSVVVARQVFNYEPTRLREGQAPWSPTGYRSAAKITDISNAIAARGVLADVDLITGKDYGSGETLIDDLAAGLRSQLLQFSGDIVGFEMEGHGVLHAVWELQREKPLQVGVIKGVSDFGDGQMQNDKLSRQVAATRRAVRVALEILRSS